LNATTGARVWTATTGNRIQDTRAIANGTVYVGSLDNRVYAFRAGDGVEVWRKNLGAAVTGSPSAANGVVYAAATNGVVHELNAGTGADVTTPFETGSAIDLSSPTVANGVVYIGNSDTGNIFALG